MMSILTGSEEKQTWASEVWAGFEPVILTLVGQKLCDYQGFVVLSSP